MVAEWISNAELVSVRAVHFAASLFLAGFWVFDRIVTKEVEEGRAWRGLLRKGSALLFFLATLSGVGWFLCVAQGMGGDLSGETLRTVWNQTAFGAVERFRAAVLLLLVVPLSMAVYKSQKRSAFSSITLVGCAVFLGSLAWAGHGGTGLHSFGHRIADVLHLLVCGVWPGGLLPLLALLKFGEIAPRVLRRFSMLSISAVALLTATGLVNAACLIGSWPALFGTAYGKTLLVKVFLFLLMVGLGAINFLRPSSARLAFRVRVEIALAIGVIGVVGLLGILPPVFFRH